MYTTLVNRGALESEAADKLFVVDILGEGHSFVFAICYLVTSNPLFEILH